MRFLTFIAVITVSWPFTPDTSNPAEELTVRVVDVGPGLCCVVKMPSTSGTGPKYMIYDAGNPKWGGNINDGGKSVLTKIMEIVPPQSIISLMVISHTDADHLGAVDEICRTYHVRRIVWPGLTRDTTAWKNAKAAIRDEVEHDNCEEVNLDETDLIPGTKYKYGPVTVTFLCGYSTPPATWDLKTKAERYNAGSIVVRLTYKSRSILFTGDAVGRHIGDPEDTILGTEKFMVDNASTNPAKLKLQSDVLIAPHHGGDNGSSLRFIQEVKPEYVIFSAGHEYRHPLTSTAKRYLKCGIALDHMFRTDRGDDETDGEGDDDWEREWDHGRVPDNHDGPGDDDVDITLSGTGAVAVKYRN